MKGCCSVKNCNREILRFFTKFSPLLSVQVLFCCCVCRWEAMLPAEVQVLVDCTTVTFCSAVEYVKKRLTMVSLCDGSWMHCCLMGEEASALINGQSVSMVCLNCASRPIAQWYTNLQEYLVLCLGNLSDWCMNCSIVPVAVNYDLSALKLHFWVTGLAFSFSDREVNGYHPPLGRILITDLLFLLLKM